MKRYFLTVFVISILVKSAYADVINVPGDQASIQAGIDAAVDGDTVLVADGTYLENINFKGKAITVASFYLIDADTSHISNTIIDGSQPSHPDSGSVVFFVSGEDTTSVLYGFTITHGTGTITTEETIKGQVDDIREGGGVFCHFSGASIIYNKIINNNVPFYNFSGGGGVSGFPPGSDAHVILVGNQIMHNTVTGDGEATGAGADLACNATLIDNVISHNTSTANDLASGPILCYTDDRSGPRTVVLRNNHITHNVANGNNIALGGGVSIESGTNASIVGNTISNNMMNGNRKLGGGIFFFENSNTLIANNIVSGNSASEGGGIYSLNSNPQIINNTIVNNTAVTGGGIRTTGARTPVVLNTIIWGNDAGSQIFGSVDIQYSDIEGAYTGMGNIDSDPFFADTLFHLSDSSACIGNGISSILVPPNDFDGNPRPHPVDEFVDIGAYESEFMPPTSVDQSNESIPQKFMLFQNYPNPFNPATTISYQLPQQSNVELTIYNMAGQKIATVVSERQPAGSYQYEWEASALASGVYFYRITADEFVQVQKLLLLK